MLNTPYLTWLVLNESDAHKLVLALTPVTAGQVQSWGDATFDGQALTRDGPDSDGKVTFSLDHEGKLPRLRQSAITFRVDKMASEVQYDVRETWCRVWSDRPGQWPADARFSGFAIWSEGSPPTQSVVPLRDWAITYTTNSDWQNHWDQFTGTSGAQATVTVRTLGGNETYAVAWLQVDACWQTGDQEVCVAMTEQGTTPYGDIVLGATWSWLGFPPTEPAGFDVRVTGAPGPSGLAYQALHTRLRAAE